MKQLNKGALVIQKNNSSHNSIVSRIAEFMENEARSGSMDFGCVTPQYVYRMWGGSVALEDIAEALNTCKKKKLYER